MVDQRVILDDRLPLAGGEVPGEDPTALAVTGRIEAGVSPLAALAAEGVRWIVVEKGTGLPDPSVDDPLPRATRITHDTPSVRVIELGAEPGEEGVGVTTATAWGWGVTCVTWLLSLGCVVLSWASSRRRGLVQSPP